MVGLSIVLEGQKGSNTTRVYKTPQVINKTLLLAPAPPSSFPSSTRFKSSSSTHLLATTSSFLDQCFLCKRKLLPAQDIYMYKGDRAFCSVECRQIIMDEEETSPVTTTSMIKRDKSCSMAAMRPRPTVSSPSSSRNRKGTRNPANGFTAY